MIRALLIENDPRLRDIIEVGLENFQAFETEHAPDAWTWSMVRDRPFDLLFVDSDLGGKGLGLNLIRQIRESDRNVEIIILAQPRSAKAVAKEKSTSNVFAVLPLPLDEQHFYKTVSRARDRIEAKQAASRGEQTQAAPEE